MKRRFTSQILGGLILIGIGAMFLLRQLGYTDFSLGYLISNYWPVILVLMGIKRLLGTGDGHSNGGSSPIGGFFFLAIGVFFLGRNLDWFDISAGEFFKMFIPVMLIGGGLYVIFKPRHSAPPVPPAPPTPPSRPDYNSSLDVEPPKPLDSTLDEQFEQKFGKPSGGQDWKINLKKDEVEDEDDTYYSTAESRWQEKQERHERRRQERDERHARRHGDWHKEFHKGLHESKDDKETTNRSAFIGDVHMGREHFQLKNTNVSQFIGDTVLDLTNAQIAYGETKINISAFIGDIKVYIPNDMDLGIAVNSSSFIGDMEVLDQSRSGFMSSVQCKTPYYKEAGKKVRINVSAFIGDIKVKTVG